jgi:hypothetical protein
MLKRVLVVDPGESTFLPGERVDSHDFQNANKALALEGKRVAEGRPELMGITKASLATDSWLAAASFQETTRVLTEAAIESKSDRLYGLKENVIIGKLVPAGTGMEVYQEREPYLPNASMMGGIRLESAASAEQAGDLAAWLRGLGDHSGDEYGSGEREDDSYYGVGEGNTAVDEDMSTGADGDSEEDGLTGAEGAEGTEGIDTDDEGTAHADAG